MKSAIFLLSSLAMVTKALHMIQWQDNMILSKDNFLALTNENVATKISERQPSIEQFFVFNLVSNWWANRWQWQIKSNMIYLCLRRATTKTTLSMCWSSPLTTMAPLPATRMQLRISISTRLATSAQSRSCWTCRATLTPCRPCWTTTWRKRWSWLTTRQCPRAVQFPTPIWRRCCQSAQISKWITTSRLWRFMRVCWLSRLLSPPVVLCISTVKHAAISSLNRGSWRLNLMVSSALLNESGQTRLTTIRLQEDFCLINLCFNNQLIILFKV